MRQQGFDVVASRTSSNFLDALIESSAQGRAQLVSPPVIERNDKLVAKLAA